MLDQAPAESPAPWSSTSVGPLPPVQTDCGPSGLADVGFGESGTGERATCS